MSETTEEIRQSFLDIRYFSEKMLGAKNKNDPQEQNNTLYELAKLIGITDRLDPVRVYMLLVSVWNADTAALRDITVTDDHARQTVFRFFGDMFAKYGLPDPGYEGDEL